MKKIFRTSVFWIAAVILFWAYVKLFDSDLGKKVANRIYPERVVIQAGTNEPSEDMVIINDQLNKINDKLLNILEVLSGEEEQEVQKPAGVQYPALGTPTTTMPNQFPK